MDKNPEQNKSKKRHKRVIKWQTIAVVCGCISVCIGLIMSAYKQSAPIQADLDYITFMEKVETGDIESVKIIVSQKYMTVTDKDGKEWTVNNPGYDEYQKDLLEAGVKIEIQKITPLEAISNALSSLPMILLAFVFMWYLSTTLMGQTTTLYKVYKAEEIIKFDSVAGMSETKEEVKFAVSQLLNTKRLKELGTKPCKGIILEGPPGTGKTLLAKAIAGEAGVPFISTNGADFIEMFAGLGAARVRRLWDLAQLNAPCVVFIDEIDAVGRRRSGGSDGATTEANQTLNELLSKMDGLGTTSGIFVVGATNRIEDLDPALLRPGRFDKHLYVGPPRTKEDRDEIIKLYIKNKKLDKDFDFDKASKLMFGFSGAEIEQSLNEAVMVSLQRGGNGVITIDDIDKATMKLISYGVSVKHSSESDRIIAATHEAGHAIVNMSLGRDVSKVSIMPYSSGIGGVTIEDVDSKEDKRMKTRQEVLNDIKVLFGGREAELIVLGDTSAGCSNDIEKATALAFSFINNFAMSEDRLVNVTSLTKLGLTTINNDTVDRINDVLTDCKKETDKILEQHKDKIVELRDRLLKEETIVGLTKEFLET